MARSCRRIAEILAPWPARRAWRSAGFALAGAGLLAATAPTPAMAQETVKIGEIEAQTGSLNTYGWMSAQGMRMAVDEINKAGGFEIAGKKYKLDLANPDTQGNPQQALIQLKQMLEQDHLKYVFGPFLTNIYKGIEPYANGFNGKFLLMGDATAMHFDLGKPGHDYVIRTWNWDAGLGHKLIKGIPTGIAM
jgi:branched-chain amino acid transport system substrate-binding protein